MHSQRRQRNYAESKIMLIQNQIKGDSHSADPHQHIFIDDFFSFALCFDSLKKRSCFHSPSPKENAARIFNQYKRQKKGVRAYMCTTFGSSVQSFNFRSSSRIYANLLLNYERYEHTQ